MSQPDSIVPDHSSPAADSLLISGDVVGEHACPACGSGVTNIFKAGRGRIYCDNACRQRAYRWRRRHGVRTCVERTGPAERLHNVRGHALRDRRDPAATTHDRRGRSLTACGTFATSLRRSRRTHHDFIPEDDSSCRSCSSLVGAGPPGSGVPRFLRHLYGPEWRSRFVDADARFASTGKRDHGSIPREPDG